MRAKGLILTGPLSIVYREIAQENSTHLQAFIILGPLQLYDMNAGIGSRACRLHVPPRIS